MTSLARIRRLLLAGTAACAACPSLAAAGEVVEDKGLRIEFRAEAVDGADALRRGGTGRLDFRITDARSGEPVRGLYPAAWVDAGEADAPLDEKGCRDRASRYLSGLIGIRPMVDLNSYFVLVMNRDATISVIDPIIGVTGITKLYDEVLLPRPGGDWAQLPGGETMFVSMPEADAVAVIDLETFDLVGRIPTGEAPLRLGLQPDGRYLWVGHGGEAAGVTVVDTATREVVAEIPTGRGHHEIAFSHDSARALVTNREDGTVSVIDVRAMAPLATIETGGVPLAVAYSALSRLAYVADGRTGEVVVIDPETARETGRIALGAGLGPARVTPDGRHLLVVNPSRDEVVVVDTATGGIDFRIPVAGKPFQVGFSRSYAYVRALETERVSMIDLDALDGDAPPRLTSFGAGNQPPGRAADLSVADVIAEAPGEAAVLVSSPADKTVYYYMEGMNAPMGNFRNYGHAPRAVSVVDRALGEGAPGTYEATMKLPVAGAMDVIMMLDSPRVLHCFRLEVAENPDLVRDDGPFSLRLEEGQPVSPGEATDLVFRLLSPRTGEPIEGLEDVRVLSYRAPGLERRTTEARHLGEGRYAVRFEPSAPGAFYLYAASASEGADFGEASYATLRVPADAGSE